MKISRIAVSALFAAGLIAASASAGYAEDKVEISGDCVEGYMTVYNEDGFVSCVIDPEVSITEVKPIDSCWETEDGVNVCARGGMVPMPATLDEPVDGGCTIVEDEEGNPLEACYDAVPYTLGEDGEVIEPIDGGIVDDSMLRDGEVDETLMYQSGIAMPGSSSEVPASNLLAAFGVLVGAVGAFGIGISRQRESK